MIEWEEWGDPLHDAEVYAYMKSYSPYENVSEPDLPADPGDDQPERHPRALPRARQVGGAAARTPRGPVLLKTEMGAGHGGRIGRYDAWREEAFALAWVITTAGG